MIMTNEVLKTKSCDSSLEYIELDSFRKLAAEMAHEVRNPLTTIKCFLQLIKPYLKDINKDEYADITLVEIDRVNEIILDFLNGVKPMMVQKEIVSVNNLVTNLIKLFESESIIKNVRLTSHLAQQTMRVSMKEREMKQVLINLIKNAFEAIEECENQTGWIDIRTEVDDKFAYIHVIDNGCGMTSDTVNQLFTPFFSTKSMGTGIGLSVCKEIIEHQDGQIYMTTTKDKGTKVTIELPICQ